MNIKINILNLRNSQPQHEWQVRVDRTSILGNPFKMFDERDRDRVCNNYDNYFFDMIRRGKESGTQNLKARAFVQELRRLYKLAKTHGKLDLFCWCAPKRCHAETIKFFLESYLNTVTVVDGDVLNATESYICHQVNCKGRMGAGIAKHIREQYPEVYNKYKTACSDTSRDLLGCVQIVGRIINIFGQRSYGTKTQQTDYEALERAFNKLHAKLPKDKSLAFPYHFGCGLAGGDWNIVFELIKRCFKGRNIRIYKLPSETNSETLKRN